MSHHCACVQLQKRMQTCSVHPDSIHGVYRIKNLMRLMALSQIVTQAHHTHVQGQLYAGIVRSWPVCAALGAPAESIARFPVVMCTIFC